MNIASKTLPRKLAGRLIRPTIQRIKILDYLINDPCHPTADQIYKDLHKEIITLSKTTIYNTLKLFARAGIVKELDFGNSETRYDVIIENHSHFLCKGCGSISNFYINLDDWSCSELNGFKIIERNVYFKGLCPDCLLNINNKLPRE
jgi:Fe2+ or Zn2+ uptake regulation protein